MKAASASTDQTRRQLLQCGAGAAAGLLLSTSSGSFAGERRRGAIVETIYGKLQGRIENGVASFKGIHYAQPAGGRNRFLPPQPVKHWAGIRDATRLGHPSLQNNPDYPAWTDPMPGSEDCLVLNVWTPERGRHAPKLPVMVWIHGGGYGFGSAGAPLYDLTNMAKAGNIVGVGINHRLHAFGFTDLSQYGGAPFAGSGNAGMLDIIAALRWVRDNIAQFGGDPNNVTVFGQSGGGAKIATLMAMPAAHGLFHKAINQSGPISRYRERAESEATTDRMFSLLNIRRGDVAALQAVPAHILLKYSDVIMNEARGTGHGSLKYAPVIDGHDLPARPWETVAPPGTQNIPMLLGTTHDETIIYMPDFARKPLGDDQAIARAVVASVPAYTPDQARVAEAIPFYRKAMGQVADPDLVLQMSTDLSYWKDVVRQTELQAKTGAPVFSYRCDWKTPCYGGQYAPHTDELPFVMGHKHYGTAWDGKDTDALRAAADPDNARFRLGDQMLRAWTNFAHHGNPSTRDLVWPRYELDKRRTMIFDRESRVEEDPRGAFRPIVRTL